MLLVWLVQPGAGAEIDASDPPAATAVDGEQNATAAEINTWVEQLGDPEFFVRERAQAALQKLGFEAFDALSAAAHHEDLEIAKRASYLLRLIDVDLSQKDDPAEVKRLLLDYDAQGIPSKLARMRALKDLANEEGVPALCRLVRYEESAVLSKQAALYLMNGEPAEGPPAPAMAAKLRVSVPKSKRSAVAWLVTWLRTSDDAKAMAAEWQTHAETEQALLRSAPVETSPQIVAALLRFRIGWLKRAGENDAALAAMRQLIDLEGGDPATLIELLDWYVEQRAWQVIDELAVRFHPQFHGSPVLLYTLAQSQRERGQKDDAEKTAREAFEMSERRNSEALVSRIQVADALRTRGLIDWAEREYRQVIDSGRGRNTPRIVGMLHLAEMLHDQNRHREAAEMLEELTKKPAPREQDPFGSDEAEAFRSRMHYFRALAAAAEGNAEGEREELLKAIGTESMDIDAMIAVNAIELTPEQRRVLNDRIAASAASAEQMIQADPKEATFYNQYAWLIGNTSEEKGQLQRALSYSKKSLELSPDTGGYYDTLAHVYFRMGDFENAVRFQRRAVELEPHSGLIRRKLEVFEKKLGETEAAANKSD
ncbi:MAG: tetratricopeptide repeat protein [Planctomycetota bacterium]